MLNALDSIVFLANSTKPDALPLAENLRSIAEREGLRTAITMDYPLKPGFLKGWDACCVIGGDGTLLGAVPEAIASDVPLLGVNLGKLGFMTVFSREEAVEHFPRILKGGYEVRTRELLRCLSADGRHGIALNDVVIRSESSKLVHLSVYADGELVNNYHGDGLIFSTSTGSTAYNLSAGGPIIHPAAKVVVMTPICPHTLSNRALVVNLESCFDVHLHAGHEDLRVTCDGVSLFERDCCYPLKIRLEQQALRTIVPTGYSYFSVLRNKLKW